MSKKREDLDFEISFNACLIEEVKQLIGNEQLLIFHIDRQKECIQLIYEALLKGEIDYAISLCERGRRFDRV